MRPDGDYRRKDVCCGRGRCAAKVMQSLKVSREHAEKCRANMWGDGNDRDGDGAGESGEGDRYAIGGNGGTCCWPSEWVMVGIGCFALPVRRGGSCRDARRRPSLPLL